MKRTLAVTPVLCLLLAACAAPAPGEPTEAESPPAASAAQPDPRGPLTLVLHQLESGETIRIDEQRAARRFSPCSTFKIPSALLALTHGAVPFEDTTLSWDAERDPRPESRGEIWERDHTLASAVENSIVWYFREVARRLGEETMQAELDRLEYGNRDISGGLDRFWLASSLAISADEQVRFLTRLQRGEFGFEDRYVDYVREALILEENADTLWLGKTGTCPLEEGGYVGWLVGGVETGGKSWLYAFNYERPSAGEAYRERLPLVRELLVEAGLLEGSQ